jgi:diguanylate cyclase (GGDEF)-like protein
MDSKNNTGLSRTLAGTETLRLVELRDVDAFFTPLEERFERLTRVGRSSLGVRVVAITVIQRDQQWFKSVNGWKVNQLALEQSLCAITVAGRATTVIDDTTRDARSAQHSLVQGPPHFRFYAGVPLFDSFGNLIGTFCAIDTAAKRLSADQQRCLEDLAAMAERELFTSHLSDGFAEMVRKLGAARREAMFDPLTRLWNRRGGVALLGVALQNLGSSALPLSICVADIDNFKRVNDLYGHPAGDQVLRKVAETIIANLRPTDVVCRLGGDEFLIVMAGTGEPQLREVALRLRTALQSNPVASRAGPISVSLSLGGVVYQGGASVTPERALEEADQALYQSKRAGRNRLSIHDGGARAAVG